MVLFSYLLVIKNKNYTHIADYFLTKCQRNQDTFILDKSNIEDIQSLFGIQTLGG